MVPNSTRRPWHQRARTLLAARGRHRRPWAGHDAEEPRLRSDHRRRTRLRLCRQRLPHLRSRRRPPEHQQLVHRQLVQPRARNRTELPAHAGHPKQQVRHPGQQVPLPNRKRQKQQKCWREPSHRQVRGPRAAMGHHLRRGADHDAAEPHCSPRRQNRTTVPESHRARPPNRRQRRQSQQLHLRRHRPRQPPRRPRRNRAHRRALRPQRSARPRQTARSLPSHPPRRRNQSIPTRWTRPALPNLPARTTLPAQPRRPARAAHR